MKRVIEAWRGPALLVAGVLATWQILYAIVGDIALRSPIDTIRFTIDMASKANFWPNLVESAKAFAAALAIAIGLGLGIGFPLGFHRRSGEVFEPMLTALYSIPKITLYPIILLTFGLGLPAKIAFGAIHGLVPIALFTINAVRNVKPIYVKTSRVLKLGPWDLVASVLFPAALPEIFTGLRIGFSLTMIGTILGEMFASQRGLGYMLMNAIGLHNVDIIMSITLILTLFAAVVSSVLLAFDRKLRARL